MKQGESMVTEVWKGEEEKRRWINLARGEICVVKRRKGVKEKARMKKGGRRASGGSVSCVSCHLSSVAGCVSCRKIPGTLATHGSSAEN